MKPAVANGAALLLAPLARLVLRPWFDRVSLESIAGWYLPLSRAWAAALAADTDIDRFRTELPETAIPEATLARILAAVYRRRFQFDAIDTRWRATFFGAGAPDLAAIETMRALAAQRLMTARALFLPARLRQRIPPVRWRISTPAETEAAHGRRLTDPAAAFPARPLPAVEESRAVLRPGRRLFWLRAASPLGDTAWARVLEPTDVRDPPTLVYLHGIGVEPEMWRELPDALSALAGRGIRVILPEGPWHGRRRIEGFYGGEPALAGAPASYLDLLAAWVAEAGAWIEWARQRGAERVGLGGTSLGALTSQLAATAARDWPAAQQPDILFLVATSGDLLATTQEGSLARSLGLTEQLARAGWTAAEMARWRPLLEPGPAPVMPPDQVVMLLGSADTVTPFAGGLKLARDWRVPDGNLFVRERGHFSVSLSLRADRAPLERAIAVLRG